MSGLIDKDPDKFGVSSLPGEVWKEIEIKGIKEGLYVSNKGRIRAKKEPDPVICPTTGLQIIDVRIVEDT